MSAFSSTKRVGGGGGCTVFGASRAPMYCPHLFFDALADKKSPSAKQIEVDLLRTFPSNKYFQDINGKGLSRGRETSCVDHFQPPLVLLQASQSCGAFSRPLAGTTRASRTARVSTAWLPWRWSFSAKPTRSGLCRVGVSEKAHVLHVPVSMFRVCSKVPDGNCGEDYDQRVLHRPDGGRPRRPVHSPRCVAASLSLPSPL